MSPLFGQCALQSFFDCWPSPCKDAFLHELSGLVDEKSSTLLDRLQRSNKNGSKVAPTAASSSSPPQSSQLDQQRRAELQLIMRDKSLNKEERRLKMDEVRDKYAALALAEEEGGSSSQEERYAVQVS